MKKDKKGAHTCKRKRMENNKFDIENPGKVRKQTQFSHEIV